MFTVIGNLLIESPPDCESLVKLIMGGNVLFDNKCRIFKIIGSSARGKSRKTWSEIIRSDVKGTKVSKDPVKDRNVLKLFIKKVKPMQNGKQML